MPRHRDLVADAAQAERNLKNKLYNAEFPLRVEIAELKKRLGVSEQRMRVLAAENEAFRAAAIANLRLLDAVLKTGKIE